MCKPSSTASTSIPTPGRPTGPRSTPPSRRRASSRCRCEVENGQGATSGIYGTTGDGIPNPAWSDGLSASAYNASQRSSRPLELPDRRPGRPTTPPSAVRTAGVYDNGTTGNATATARRTGRLLPDAVDGWQLHELRTPHLRFAAHCGSASAGPQWRASLSASDSADSAVRLKDQLSARPGSAAWPRQWARRRWPPRPPRRHARRPARPGARRPRPAAARRPRG